MTWTFEFTVREVEAIYTAVECAPSNDFLEAVYEDVLEKITPEHVGGLPAGVKPAAENRETTAERNRYRAALEDISEGIFSGNQAADWARRALKRGQVEKPVA